jgi:hypothetical protein
VDEYMEQISFNDTTEIISKLKRVDIDIKETMHLPSIDNMIKRRHNIVHQADANNSKGSGSYHALSIDKKTIENWIENTDNFVNKIFELIRHKLSLQPSSTT